MESVSVEPLERRCGLASCASIHAFSGPSALALWRKRLVVLLLLVLPVLLLEVQTRLATGRNNYTAQPATGSGAVAGLES
jgi:hypothetical protein